MNYLFFLNKIWQKFRPACVPLAFGVAVSWPFCVEQKIIICVSLLQGGGKKGSGMPSGVTLISEKTLFLGQKVYENSVSHFTTTTINILSTILKVLMEN